MPDPIMSDAPMDDSAKPVDEQKKAEAPEPVDNNKIAKTLHGRVEVSKKNCRSYHSEWQRNVDLRIGKIGQVYTGGLDLEDDVQTEINPDWSLTKTKTANLYSQVPTVQMVHENKAYIPALAPFCKAVNYEISEKRANIGVAMEEVLNDVVNAAGVGAIEVGYAARFDSKLVPAVEQLKQLPPEALQQLQQVEVPEGTVIQPDQLQIMLAAKQMPMLRQEVVSSYKFFTTRVSPDDIIWPVEFVGSNFDDADYIGRRGRCSWANALTEFKPTETSRGLEPEDKEKATSSGVLGSNDTLRSDETQHQIGVEHVKFVTLYYWRHRVDPDEKYFEAIWKIVWVDGIEDPVIHEPWKGQKLDEQSHKYVGANHYPIRILTLTYITDNPIPPSDSQAGRPQVNDLRRSRSQMFQNRERSIPIRGFDVNRVSLETQQNLMRGTVQGMIPFNGNAQNSIWEVARAAYPSEDLAFDQSAKADLMESWQIGPNQLGTTQPGKKTSAEANIQQAAFATRIGQERAKVAYFFLGCVEVLMGWMVLYSDFPSLSMEERQAMQKVWDQKHITQDIVLKILPDSTIVLDTTAQIQRLMQFINMTAKSGYVNVEPVIMKIAELSGMDPAEVMIKPQPKVEEPSVSFGFRGKDDLSNVMVMATMIHKKVAPTPEEIDQAKQIIASAGQPVQPKPPTPTGQPGPGAAGPGAPGAHPPAPGAPPGQPPAGGPNEAHPDWQMMSKIAKRSREMSPGG